ncbi:MAG: hypothetical protein ABL878_18865 [Burkholderiales bacterium]
MKSIVILAGLSLSIASLGAIGAEVDTRGGTCNDAKSQYDYYCTGKGDPNDIFTQANIACNNAKRNMAAACEGVVAPDAQYQFKEGTPKQ